MPAYDINGNQKAVLGCHSARNHMSTKTSPERTGKKVIELQSQCLKIIIVGKRVRTISMKNK